MCYQNVRYLVALLNQFKVFLNQFSDNNVVFMHIQYSQTLHARSVTITPISGKCMMLNRVFRQTTVTVDILLVQERRAYKM